MHDQEKTKSVLNFFRPGTAHSILKSAALFGGVFSEIRVYRNGLVVLVCNGRNVRTQHRTDDDEFDEVISHLCSNSLYAHSETIRDGFIFTSAGLRVGVCGHAVIKKGRIELLSEITSLCIRIPARHPGTADDLLPYIIDNDQLSGMLIRSPPGVGKTTVLRELAVLLSDPPRALRIGVVDTRFEIGYGLTGRNIDIFSGYPRAVGMEIAVRTMAPQILLCDEISGDEDSEAVLRCKNAGVAVIATVHAGSYNEVIAKTEMAQLLDSGVFRTLVGLSREGNKVRHEIKVLEPVYR